MKNIKDSFCDKGHYFNKSECREKWNGLDKCPYCHPSYDCSGAVTLSSECPDEIVVSLSEKVLETPAMNIKIPTDPLSLVGIDPPAFLPERKRIDVYGRVEHEALLRDEAKMIELGLDPIYERIVYLNRWGKWLDEA